MVTSPIPVKLMSHLVASQGPHFPRFAEHKSNNCALTQLILQSSSKNQK